MANIDLVQSRFLGSLEFQVPKIQGRTPQQAMQK